MPVKVKKIDIEMEVKTKGIEFEVRDAENHIGDLVVSKAGLVWCKGRTQRKNGIRITWAKFAEMMEDR